MNNCEICGNRGYVLKAGSTVCAMPCTCLDQCECDDGYTNTIMHGVFGSYDGLAACPVCSPSRREAQRITGARIPVKYQGADVRSMEKDEGNKRAIQYLIEWLRSPIETGWTLRGPVGVGKTRVLAATIYALAASPRSPISLFLDLGEWLQEMREGIDTGLAERIRRHAHEVPVLALDELGGVRTEWEIQQVADLICGRYSKRLPTLITTNLDRRQIAVMLDGHGGRVISRLNEMSPEVLIEGADRRRA